MKQRHHVWSRARGNVGIGTTPNPQVGDRGQCVACKLTVRAVSVAGAVVTAPGWPQAPVNRIGYEYERAGGRWRRAWAVPSCIATVKTRRRKLSERRRRVMVTP